MTELEGCDFTSARRFAFLELYHLKLGFWVIPLERSGMDVRAKSCEIAASVGRNVLGWRTQKEYNNVKENGSVRHCGGRAFTATAQVTWQTAD
jgi:hypothetical protein